MRRLITYCALAVATVFGSCSTEFDVNAPWQDYTIVYGLLDPNDSLHYVKINKAFLGSGSAYDYAAIRDSSEYAQVDAQIEEWSGNTRIAVYPLRDTVLQNREPGVFHSPDHKVYYFIRPNLNISAEYRLHVSLLEGEKIVTGRTTMVKDFNFLNPPVQFSFISGVGNYMTFYLRYNTGPEGRRYDTWLYFNYDEETTSGTVRKTLPWKLDSYITLSLAGSERREIIGNGEAFYAFLKSRIPAPDASVIRRVVRPIDLVVVGVSDDVYTYMKVNEPSTGLIQEKPAFTNIDNGIGVFSSRFTKKLSRPMNLNSTRELCQGAYTGHLGFCTDNTDWASESFFCN